MNAHQLSESLLGTSSLHLSNGTQNGKEISVRLEKDISNSLIKSENTKKRPFQKVHLLVMILILQLLLRTATQTPTAVQTPVTPVPVTPVSLVLIVVGTPLVSHLTPPPVAPIPPPPPVLAVSPPHPTNLLTISLLYREPREGLSWVLSEARKLLTNVPNPKHVMIGTLFS
uniref:Uncharacterized protein n=1 Tax=Homalodisca liturata TaxID=320908 RepID=A0A1B6IWC1_9HEMI